MRTFAFILAAGKGTRIKDINIPKQFVKIKQKPLFIYCLEKFCKVEIIDHIILVISEEYEQQVNEWIKLFLYEYKDKIVVMYGSNSRNGSLARSIKYANKKFKFNNEDIILTHDAARIFVNEDIIKKSIKTAAIYTNSIINTCVKLDDSIAYKPEQDIKMIPNRNKFLIIQTPQTSTWRVINYIYSKKYDQNIFNNTELSGLGNINNIPIEYIKGNKLNFKITTNEDLDYAYYLINR